MRTKHLSIEEVEKILSNGDITQLVGVEETSYFEFRERSYITTKDNPNRYKSKFELVRDVTAIANSGGGLICLGLKSKEKKTEKKEYVETISGINKAHVQLGSWMDILADMVVPRFSQSNIEYGYAGENDEVFWMRIKDAKETGTYPFILVKDQWEPTESQHVNGVVFGYYYRDGAQNIWISPEKLQQYIANGIADFKGNNALAGNEILRAQIQSMGTKLDALASSLEAGNGFRVEKKIKKMNEKMIKYASSKLGGYSGFFYIHAMPKEEIVIPEFWHQGNGSVYQILKEPPKLREMGWDLDVATSEYPFVNGSAWQIMNGDRKITSFSQDGEIFTAGAIQDFLDWGTNVLDKKIKLINNLALTEYVDVFFHFFYIARSIFDLQKDYVLKFGFVMPDGLEYKLHQPNRDGSVMSMAAGSLSQTHGTLEIKASDSREPKLLAAEVMVMIYSSSFGLKEQQFAYLTKVNDSAFAIDEDLYTTKK